MKPVTAFGAAVLLPLLITMNLLTGCGGGGGGGAEGGSSSSSVTSSSSSQSSSTTPEDELAVFELNPTLLKSEEEKQLEVNDSTRPYRYLFDTPVTLYVADAPGRPAAVPGIRLSAARAIDAGGDVLTDPVPVYNSGYRTAFVEEGKDETRWFAFTVNDEKATGVVWQVSTRPFNGNEEDWKTPEGLIASGTQGMVDGYNGEFSIDFSALGLSDAIGTKYGGDAVDARLAPKQRPVYVRAVAVDKKGYAVGEMGRGLEVLYGARLGVESATSGFVFVFNLLTPYAAGNPNPGGETHFPLDNYTEHACNLVDSYNWYFRPEGFPAETETLRLQVTAYPATVEQESWRDPAGLVYEEVLNKGSNPFDQLPILTTTLPIDFSMFAEVGKQYYVRAVALAPGDEVGTVKATYSKTVLFSCVPDDGTDIVYYPPPEPLSITPDLPQVTLQRYEPIAWEDSEWMYWYQIVRRPTVRELTYGLIPDDSLAAGYAVGDYFKLNPPTQEDKAWYEEAWDAVSDFFSDLVDYASKVTDWVASKYNSAKAYLVTYVAENLPGVPEDWRDELKDALEYAVDYGMASMGIPPELPTFDQLTGEGLDYMASNALDMAGIPDTDLTNKMVQDLAGDLQETFENEAASGNTPNPLGWTFVRQYTGTMYRPAYLLVDVHNPYGVKTPSGTLRGSVTAHVTSDDILGSGDIATLSATFGGTHDFELYRPVEAIRIPTLLPGQTITVPVYFQEYTGAKYAFSPTTVSQNDFIRMYNNLSFFFSFRIDFDLPSAQSYALAHGEGPSETGYEYTLTSKGFHFTGEPWRTYVP